MMMTKTPGLLRKICAASRRCRCRPRLHKFPNIKRRERGGIWLFTRYSLKKVRINLFGVSQQVLVQDCLRSSLT